MRPTRILLTTAAACGCLLPVTQADAAGRFTIRGAGFGHGVGMSQYGAYGYAMQGANYRQILAHYYTGTALGAYPDTTVRVLLQSSVATARFSGATAAGDRRLDPSRTYGARVGKLAGTVDLLSPSGRRLMRVTAPLRVTSSAGVTVLG